MTLNTPGADRSAKALRPKMSPPETWRPSISFSSFYCVGNARDSVVITGG